MCSLKAVTMLALHHKEPSHLYCHFFCGFCVVCFVLFCWLVFLTEVSLSVDPRMPLKLENQLTAHHNFLTVLTSADAPRQSALKRPPLPCIQPQHCSTCKCFLKETTYTSTHPASTSHCFLCSCTEPTQCEFHFCHCST